MKKLLRFALLTILFGFAVVLFCSCENENKPAQNAESNTETKSEETQPEEQKPFYPASEAPESLKILGVGNSFSQDTFEYFVQIAKSAGVKDVVVGNLVIGGCNLETHLKHAKENDAAYSYEKNVNGKKTANSSFRYSRAVRDEEWDIIFFQQQSKYSGVASTYQPYLNELIEITDGLKTNPDVRFFWHMTWSLQKGYSGSNFDPYGHDQMKMYNMITGAVQSEITKLDKISGIIPNGTAIQNARATVIGDTLNRDGLHLDLNLGRYIAGLTCYAAVTLDDISDIDFVPSDDISPELIKAAKESIIKAMNDPFVTK